MFAMNGNLCCMITELQDSILSPGISGADLMAAQAKYLLKCMTDLRKKFKESQAFFELVEYVKDSVCDDKSILRLSELHSLYVCRLDTLGVNKEINKTRLKMSLLEYFPDAQEQSDGKNILIVFKTAIHRLLKHTVLQRDFSEDATILAYASEII